MALSLRKREPPRGRYTPALWPLSLVVPVALLVAGLLGWAIYQYAYDYFAQVATSQKPVKPVNVNDVLKATVTALTLVGAVLAGLYAYRKQLLSEGDAHRADASQLAHRYTTAAEQLGHEQAAVRLAGVYALARLADDWEEQRQVCIDVLCAYLRMPYQPDPDQADHKAGEREVRHTVIRVIRDHLQQPDSPISWCTYAFNFTGALFDGGDFSHSHFRGMADFGGATFSSGTVYFSWVDLSDDSIVNFGDATFTDGSTVSFREATFTGASRAYFHRAVFDHGTVVFSDATFTGDSTVNFREATFNDGGTVNFTHTNFSDSTVNFGDATFNGGTVNFTHARFAGGRVDFSGATRNGGRVNFTDAIFTGTISEWGTFPVPSGA
ncbi:pentapeptide repeat-containing protein [Streptomyces sp. NPDC085927]|uniref:pentapeptide repeat-containing protein n=1 Tax=Streptomyces sp. NPDC085927 TaxID=3365738 RepID=UPI0037CEA4EB